MYSLFSKTLLLPLLINLSQNGIFNTDDCIPTHKQYLGTPHPFPPSHQTDLFLTLSTIMACALKNVLVL